MTAHTRIEWFGTLQVHQPVKALGTDHNTEYPVYADADDCGHPNPDENPEYDCKHNGECCGEGVECKTRAEFDAAMADWEDNHTSGTGIDGESVTICHATPMGIFCEECSEEQGDWVGHIEQEPT